MWYPGQNHTMLIVASFRLDTGTRLDLLIFTKQYSIQGAVYSQTVYSS
jgi:hypothetical protein